MATRTLHAHRYFAPLVKYFTVCITYQPPLVGSNPISSPVTIAKELGTITFYNEGHNVKEIIKLCEVVNISVPHKTVKMGK